jgi:hypothetical protein
LKCIIPSISHKIMYARAFVHSNQILILTDPINSELLYQIWSYVGSICGYILVAIYNILCAIWSINQVNIPALWIFIGVIIYNINLVRLINILKTAEDDIGILKLNINRITTLFANRDDYLDDYIKATEYELRNIKKDMYKYTKKE